MQVVSNPIQRSAIIELVIPDFTRLQQIPFPDQPYLRGRKIQAIHASPSQTCQQSGRKNWAYELGLGTPTLIGFPMYVTLVDQDNSQFVQNMPLLELLVASSAFDQSALTQGIYNTNGITVLDPRAIVWPKSFIYFPLAPTTLSGYSLQLQVYYQ